MRLAAPDALQGSLIILAVVDEELSDEVRVPKNFWNNCITVESIQIKLYNY